MASTERTARNGSPRRPIRRRSAARRPFALLSLSSVVLSVAALGCGYSLSARTNPHIASVAIPIFENKTLESGLEEPLAKAVTDAFLEDKKLRVVKEKDADSVILGVIERYDRTPFSYDRDQNVQEYKVEITLRVTYEDRRKNRVAWEEPALGAWGTYSVSTSLPAGVEEERAAQERAFAKAAQDILIKAVQGW
jgi:hypothetical protein